MFNIKTPNSTGSFSRVLTFDSDVVPILYDCYFAQGSQYCKLPQPTGSTFTSMQVFSTNPAYVTIRCQSSEHTGKDGVFILEYTKTTDTATVKLSTPVAAATYDETTPETVYQELTNGNDTPTEI